MKHEDNYEAFWLRINPARNYSTADAAMRPLPRFAALPYFKKGEGFRASIPTARRSWWIWGLVAIFLLWFTFLPVAFGAGYVAPEWGHVRGRWTQIHNGYWSPFWLLLVISVLIVITIAIMRTAFPRIKVEADRDGITVGQYRYDWQNAAGMRVGYSIGGVERSSEQGALWLKFTGLRMAYGQWGHDLPYMASNYYSVAYVAWINQLLETVELNTETVNNPAAGIKQELY